MTSCLRFFSVSVFQIFFLLNVCLIVYLLRAHYFEKEKFPFIFLSLSFLKTLISFSQNLDKKKKKRKIHLIFSCLRAEKYSLLSVSLDIDLFFSSRRRTKKNSLFILFTVSQNKKIPKKNNCFWWQV